MLFLCSSVTSQPPFFFCFLGLVFRSGSKCRFPPGLREQRHRSPRKHNSGGGGTGKGPALSRMQPSLVPRWQPCCAKLRCQIVMPDGRDAAARQWRAKKRRNFAADWGWGCERDSRREVWWVRRCKFSLRIVLARRLEWIKMNMWLWAPFGEKCDLRMIRLSCVRWTVLKNELVRSVFRIY